MSIHFWHLQEQSFQPGSEDDWGPTMMRVVFLVSLLWLIWVYLLYPVTLRLCYLIPRQRRSVHSGTRGVTVVIAAFNEASCIAETVRNKLDLNFSPQQLEVIVVSDESTDGTDDLLLKMEQESNGRVRYFRQAPRQGKTAALNLAVSRAQGEIIVFSDANSLYEPQAVERLVERFADPTVGYVTGKMIYENPEGSVIGDGCTAYMRYENRIRTWESHIGSVVGVDGGIDAVRRELYVPMEADQLPDFVLPLQVVRQGYRVVYEPDAVLREPALSVSSQEYRMRVRVTLRAFWALYDLRNLFNPIKFPLFSWQLMSHKLLRYLAFIPQVGLLLSNIALLRSGPFYWWALSGQGVFYLLAVLGFSKRNATQASMLSSAPYYLVLLNAACFHAMAKFLRGQKQVLWKPRGG